MSFVNIFLYSTFFKISNNVSNIAFSVGAAVLANVGGDGAEALANVGGVVEGTALLVRCWGCSVVGFAFGRCSTVAVCGKSGSWRGGLLGTWTDGKDKRGRTGLTDGTDKVI